MKKIRCLEILLASAAMLYGCGSPENGQTAAGAEDTEVTGGNPELVQPSEWWRVHPRPVYETLEKVGTYQEWFDVYRLTDGTYAIYEPNQFEEAISYLVEGSERAVLIDTGNGIGDLSAVAEALTDLPVSVVLTHEHYDHVAGAWRFDHITAYDDPVSLARMAEGRSNESLQGYVTEDYLWKPLPDGWDPSTWTIPPIEPDDLVTDGDFIDLGGRTLEVIYTPGHSPGSMSLLDPTNRLLFTGDHFFPGPLYVYPEDVVLGDYIASNLRLVDRLSEFDWVLSGHNDPWVSSEVLPRVSQAFETILSGGGEFSEADGLRRYFFEGFDVLIRSDMVGD
ncbi:MAG: MBL fold metallo-hydrolase [Gemmatimonadetes bacterium]|nr:MBL fold metallo-hydrolase [Gemmatimonadota bacterium]NNM07334.1 MBL fold metallo-hydrolase [Gemmatimonadota bacterium]